MSRGVVKVGLLGDTRVEKAQLNRKDLGKQLAAVLTTKSIEEVASLFTDEVQFALEYLFLSRGARNVCQKASLLYNPHRLDVVAGISKRSVYQAIKDPHYCDALARAMLSQEGRQKARDLFYYGIGMNVEGVQYVNEFPPHVARDIYLQFGLHKRSRILDPCAGWGGRMIGASVVSDRYLGFEPSTLTSAGLQKLSKRLTEFSPDFKGVVKTLPFEDSQLPDDYFDIALTSPPYYDTERYTDEETNSLNRYSTFEEWCDGFYIPLLSKTLRALKPGAAFVLNIGSRKYPLNDVMRDYCKKTGHRVEKMKGTYLSGKGGLGKSGEGETFYAIFK